jgi:hypothetical protein
MRSTMASMADRSEVFTSHDSNKNMGYGVNKNACLLARLLCAVCDHALDHGLQCRAVAVAAVKLQQGRQATLGTRLHHCRIVRTRIGLGPRASSSSSSTSSSS